MRPWRAALTAASAHSISPGVAAEPQVVRNAQVKSFAVISVASQNRNSHPGSGPIPVLLVALFAIACASASTPPPGSVPRGYVAATRPRSDCAVERARTTSWALTDTTGLQRPLTRHLVIAPLPFPPDFQRANVDLRVAEDGSVIPDSIWIEGVTDRAYENRLRQSIRGYKYWPAVLNGCAVSARTKSGVGRSPRR
jgi:hypothetical protein